jgi:tripartite ATP-independent transporter DctM subunit
MEMHLTLMLIAMGVFLAINIPVAFAIALSSLVFMVLKGGIKIEMLVQRMVNGTDSFPLLAIPFFILAGELMNRVGITRRLFTLASAMVGHITGGLAHIDIVANTIMAGTSGSSVADAAGTAKVWVPVMAESGYKKSFAAAVTAAAATIAPVIPPSIGMIIYAAISGASVGRLFLGGFLPGILMAITMMATAYILCRRIGYGPATVSFSWRRVLIELKKSLFALFMPVIILGGILAGLCTPTEAAAVAAVYAGVVGMFIYKEIGLKDLPPILLDAAVGTAIIGLIMAAATPFGWIIVWERMPQIVMEWVVSVTKNPVVFLMLVNVFLLILGTFMDSIPIMVMLIPILTPIMIKFGIDLTHFGLILIINLMIAGLTPPYGILLFTVSGITKVPVSEVVKEVLPFMLTIFLVLMMVTYLPSIVLFLPNLFMGVPK